MWLGLLARLVCYRRQYRYHWCLQNSTIWVNWLRWELVKSWLIESWLRKYNVANWKELIWYALVNIGIKYLEKNLIGTLRLKVKIGMYVGHITGAPSGNESTASTWPCLNHPSPLSRSLLNKNLSTYQSQHLESWINYWGLFTSLATHILCSCI